MKRTAPVGIILALGIGALILAIQDNNKNVSGTKTAGSSGVITVLPGQSYTPTGGLTDRYGNRVY